MTRNLLYQSGFCSLSRVESGARTRAAGDGVEREFIYTRLDVCAPNERVRRVWRRVDSRTLLPVDYDQLDG